MRVLPYSQLAAQLHMGHTLGMHGYEMCGYDQFPVAALGALHDGPGLDAKGMFVFGTVIRHIGVCCNVGSAILVVRTYTAVRPYASFEPLHGGVR